MDSSNLEHHKRFEYCHNRLQYRNGKTLTAVKVYSIANESSHLLIFGVPKINLHSELKRSLEKYGPLESLEIITQTFARSGSSSNFEIEQFTDVYHAKFKKIENARRCKKFFDARNFYGGILHISYAPELESNDDIRQKLAQRKREVEYRIRLNSKHRDSQGEKSGCTDDASNQQQQAKRPRLE